MLSSITAHSVANAVRMKRTASDLAVVIVEGGSDKRLLTGVLSNNTCRIEVSHGKSNLLEATKILLAAEFRGFVSIADADFARVQGERPPDNVLFTDFHDLECMLLNSSALAKIWIEYGSEEKTIAFATSNQGCIAKLLKQAFKIGMLRLASIEHGLNLKFDGMKFVRFVNEDNMIVNESDLIAHVLGISHRDSPDERIRIARLVSISSASFDAWQIVCGHDVIELLSLAFRKTLGSNSSAIVSTESVERALRLAYSREDFFQSALAKDLFDWQGRNPTYIVLSGSLANKNQVC